MNNQLKGILLTFSANISFTIMAIFIAYLRDVSSFTSALFRFGTGIIVILAGLLFGIGTLRFNNKSLLCIRGILGGTAITLFFLTLTKIGLGRATLIFHLYPAFAAITAIFFLKERLTGKKIISFILAFMGIYVLSKAKGIPTDNLLLWDILALTGALVSGFAINTIRKLHETDSTNTIFFAQCIGGVLIVSLPGIRGIHDPGIYEIVMLLCIGISATIGQLFMTQGFKFLSVATGSQLHMTIPFFSMIAGVLLFNEPFGRHQVLAFILITSSCVILVAKRRHSDAFEE